MNKTSKTRLKENESDLVIFNRSLFFSVIKSNWTVINTGLHGFFFK